MPIKEKDFVEVEYTGKIKEDSIIFDTTDGKTAKDNNIHNPNVNYGPIVVCIGEGHLLKGLEDNLVGKEPGKFHFELKPEDAFGKKNAKLLKLVPTSVFRKQGIMPQPGLQVNIDGILGTVRTATGGRCIVDFNHPLSGKEIVYDIKVNKIITDAKEKVAAMVNLQFNLKKDDFLVEETEGSVNVKFNKKINLNKEIEKKLSEKIIELAAVTKVEFTNKKE